ncbi:MAG: hypothetical protein AAGA58_04780 [Verrucomicrobiota bacterium]
MKTLLESLPSEYDYLRKIQKLWTHEKANFWADQKGFHLEQFSCDPNAEHHGIRRNFLLKGIKVYDKRKKMFVPCEVLFVGGLGNMICFEDAVEAKFLDSKKIDLESIFEEEFIIQNPDKDVVDSLLKDLNQSKREKLDLDNIFPVELSGVEYFSVFDMEDGDYIAIDKMKSVFRLKHDSDFPVKKIFQSIDDFLNRFSGDKEELERFFQDDFD